MRDLIKGQEVIFIREASSMWTKEIRVSKQTIKSSGKKETQFERGFEKLDTILLTRSVESVKKSNFVGCVIVENESDIDAIVEHIIEVNNRCINRRKEQLKEKPNNKRLLKSLQDFKREFTVEFSADFKKVA